MVTESEARALYATTLHFDGLNICNFSRTIFAAWRTGGIDGKWFEEHADLITQAHTVSDIRKAHQNGKTAVLLSWQNTAGIEDQLDYLRVFRDLGVRKMQLTYNTQNYSGVGYTEANDSGLTGFGREVVREMAGLGIVCDLSHFAPEGRPPCFSHVLPAGMKEHPRNKSDELITLLGSKGGFVGLSQFGPHMRKGNDSTIDDYVEALEYVIGLIGEDLVGIGSDSSEGYGRPSEFMAWCNRDKGYARQLTPWGSQKVIKPLGKLEDRAELAVAMARRGWSEERMQKVLGENWLRYLEKIFGE
ncbi:Metallo-dependent hydrolase [Byssothecium circinans]|uniref:Dipeptidase n=1 Tax=Byssothecium circinans TaxID=147558 RepID=A0A6A5TXD9_9PLEO|nr:Metallo-dependent hydrolase [Byssothecium circinans]